MTTEMNHAREQAQRQLESIQAMVNALATATTDEQREAAEQVIHEDPLEVLVRSPWHAVGDAVQSDSEFLILLCTGGPAVRLIGTLSEHQEPETVQLEYQDWGTPWTEYIITDAEQSACLTYAQQFSFAG